MNKLRVLEPREIRLVRQVDNYDCGYACLAMVYGIHGEYVRKTFMEAGVKGALSPNDLVDFAVAHGSVATPDYSSRRWVRGVPPQSCIHRYGAVIEPSRQRSLGRSHHSQKWPDEDLRPEHRLPWKEVVRGRLVGYRQPGLAS